MQSQPDGSSRVRTAVETYEGSLVAYANGLVRNVDVARDLVQETFLRLCRHIDVVGDERIAPWLFKVCRNVCFDNLRKDGRVVPMDTAATEHLLAPASADVEDFGAALTAIEALPANQREVLKLKFLHDLSYREIAEITELSVSNVGYLIHVGLRAVRRTLRVKPLPIMEVSR